jgi:hypothetical protein
VRRAAVTALLVLLAGAAALALWVRAESPVTVSWTDDPSAAPVDTRLMDREFRTRDSLILTGSQIVQRSRGSIVLVHGLGDHRAFMTRDVGLLIERLNYNLLGLSLRGTARSPQVAPSPVAFDRDIAAMIGELKRREPSGPVILLGIGAGAALVARYLESLPEPGHPAPDGLILLHPLTTDSALLLSPLAWHTSVRVWPRRLRLARAASGAGVPWLRALRVAETVRPIVPAHADVFRAAAVLSLAPRDAWGTWRQSPLPTVLLTATPPDSLQYPITDAHGWHAIGARETLSLALAPTLDEFLSPFAEAANFRMPVPSSRVVPVIPPRP